MHEQTYLEYAQAVRDYLAAEWPEASALLDQDATPWQAARRELVGITMGQFMAGAAVPVAAAIAAESFARLR